MGIQYLFKNLISEKKIIENKHRVSDYVIFIDFSCIFYNFLYACNSESEFFNNINNYIKDMINNDNKLKIFIDKGSIQIKNKERNIRKIQDNKCIKKIDDKINNIDKIISNNEINNEIKKKELACLNYKLKTYDNKYRKQLLNTIISSLSKCKIYVKEYVDAEFYMCKKIIYYTKKHNNKKILIISNDQDVFLFLLNNYTIDNYINIKYYNKVYKLIIDNVSKNISILTLFFNKSDYFGIKHYLYDTNKINPIMLHFEPEYTCEYIIRICKELLKDKINLRKKIIRDNNNDELVILYIKQIIMYIKIDYNIFNENIVSDIKINNILYMIKNCI